MLGAVHWLIGTLRVWREHRTIVYSVVIDSLLHSGYRLPPSQAVVHQTHALRYFVLRFHEVILWDLSHEVLIQQKLTVLCDQVFC